MAQVIANGSLDMRTIDFSWYWKNWVEGNVRTDWREEIFGTSYPDSSILHGAVGDAHYGLQYCGDMTFDDDGWATGGKINAIVEFAWQGAYDPVDPAWTVDDAWWVMVELNISAVAFEKAVKTGKKSDEQALIKAAFAGTDGLYLSDGDDYFNTYGGRDLLNGGGGNDTLFGGGGGDQLWGEDGDDKLNAGTGNDTLDGDYGADILTGGKGRDAFRYLAWDHSGNTLSEADVIVDFQQGSDRIEFHVADTSAAMPGDQGSFLWRGKRGISTSPEGELRYQQFDQRGTAKDITVIYGDIDTDPASDFMIVLKGLHKLTADDFVL